MVRLTWRSTRHSPEKVSGVLLVVDLHRLLGVRQRLVRRRRCRRRRRYWYRYRLLQTFHQTKTFRGIWSGCGLLLHLLLALLLLLLRRFFRLGPEETESGWLLLFRLKKKPKNHSFHFIWRWRMQHSGKVHASSWRGHRLKAHQLRSFFRYNLLESEVHVVWKSLDLKH